VSSFIHLFSRKGNVYSEKCDTNRLFEMPVEVYKYIYDFLNFFVWSLAKCGIGWGGVLEWWCWYVCGINVFCFF